MKYCPNCGEPLEDDALFCPECGEKAPEAPVSPAAAPAAPAPAAEPEVTKKKSSVGKKIGIIAAIVLGVLLAAAAVLYFTGAYRSFIPDGRMKLGLAEKALVEKKLDEAFKYAPETSDINASLEVTGSIEDDGSFGLFDEMTYYKMMLEKAKLAVDIDVNSEHRKLSAELGYAGSPLLSAKLINEGGKVGIYVPQLDSNYYTMTEEALLKLASEDGAAPAELPEIDLTPFDEAKTRQEVLELLEIFSGLSTGENTEIKHDTPVTLFGGERAASVTEYLINPTPEQVKAVLNAAADKLGREDSYLGKKLGGYYSVFASAAAFTDDNSAALPAAIRRLAEDYPEDSKLVIDVYMIGEEIISQRFTYDDQTVGYDHELTESTERTYFFDKETGSINTVEVVKKTDVPDTDEAGTVTFTPNGGEKTVIDYHFDMTKRTPIGSYAGNFSVKAAGSEIATCVIDDDEAHTHTIRIVPPEGEGDGITGINVIAKVSEGGGVNAPSDAPVDLSDRSPEEIAEVFDNMLSQLGGVLLGGLLSGFGL